MRGHAQQKNNYLTVFYQYADVQARALRADLVRVNHVLQPNALERPWHQVLRDLSIQQLVSTAFIWLVPVRGLVYLGCDGLANTRCAQRSHGEEAQRHQRQETEMNRCH